MLVEKQISQAYSRISECKNELAQAKRIRKNRQGNKLVHFRSSVFTFSDANMFKVSNTIQIRR